MRKLALFSFSFAGGTLFWLLGQLKYLPFSPWVTWCIIVLCFLVVILSCFLKGRKERAAAICAAGIAAGLLWSPASHALFFEEPADLAADPAAIRLELNAYPVEKDYGCTLTGYLEADGRRFLVTAYVGESGNEWKPGDVLMGTGALEATSDIEDEYDRYYRATGVPLRASLFDGVTVEPAERIPVQYYPAVISHALKEASEKLFPRDIEGYATALLTGEKDGLSYQQKSDLQISGVYHALAVSGMHVSILMSVLGFLTMRHRRLYPLLGFPILAVYCLMMGAVPSVVRASVMYAFLMAAPLVGRDSDSPTAMGAALLLLTVQNPWCLLDVGLQLSFLATAGILAFQKKIYAALRYRKKKKFAPVWNALAGTAATTLSALVLTTPVTSWQFGSVSMLSVLSNILMLPAITAAFVLCLLAGILYLLIGGAAAILAYPATILFRYVAWCARWISSLPFSAVYFDSPYLVIWMAFSYGLALWLLFRKRKTARRSLAMGTGCSVILLCVALLCTWLEGNTFSFSVLDVGQGQCLLYRSRGIFAAVDCGGSDGDEAGDLLARRLISEGRDRLSYLVLTHYDEDHTGGLRQLLYRVSVDCILLPEVADESGTREEIEMLAEEYGTEILYVKEGLTLALGNGSLEIFPPVNFSGGNESSLSVLASFGDYDILATGDMTDREEKQLLEKYGLSDVELLVAGHHGSKGSTGETLLETLRPELVVISVGENSYGHPSEETLERIEAVGAQILRTDQNGTVTIRR